MLKFKGRNLDPPPVTPTDVTDIVLNDPEMNPVPLPSPLPHRSDRYFTEWSHRYCESPPPFHNENTRILYYAAAHGVQILMDSMEKQNFVWSILGWSLLIWGGVIIRSFLFERVYWKISQTPRNSIIKRDWHLSDCLRCTTIYQMFGMWEVYRIDMNLWTTYDCLIKNV